MAVPTPSIVADAGLFRRAYPRWPHAEPWMTVTDLRRDPMSRPVPVFHGCDCPPGELVVIMPVELDGVMHEFTGAGPTESDADFDAERHAIEALGEDCIRYPSRPA